LKVCWIKGGGLVPPDFGGRIRSFHMVKALAERHDVTLVTFYREQADDAHPQLKGLFSDLVLAPMRLPESRSAADFLLYASTFPTGLPHTMAKYYTGELRRTVEGVLRRGFDVVVCDFIFPAGLLHWNSGTKTILFMHNVESEIWERQARVARGWVERTASRMECRALRKAEEKYVRLADRVVAVSERNKEVFAQYAPPSRIDVVSTGVDLDYFHPTPEAELPDRVAFTGSYDWAPNRDAAEWYFDEILPKIRERIPKIETWIVGKSPPASLRKRAEADPAFHVTGRVEDVREYLRPCPVYVVPMRSGSGTRLKVFEAMASGKAIVSTRTGAEGLPAVHEREILLADSPAEFARQVVRALQDEGLRRRLGAAARSMVEERFSWKKVAQEFEAILLRTVNGAPA
jgi:sugar transferase (PEP-CTERM/EpsH1 system associated)